MNNVIKTFLFSVLIGATVTVKSGDVIPFPTEIPVGTKVLPVLYDEDGRAHVVNNEKKIFVVPSSSNRPGCVSPVLSSEIKVNS
jgi:hypothetical protein